MRADKKNEYCVFKQQKTKKISKTSEFVKTHNRQNCLNDGVRLRGIITADRGARGEDL